MVTDESSAPQCLKEKIIKSSSNDTTVTDVFTGMYARVIRNEFTEIYKGSGLPVLPPGSQLLTTMDILKHAGKNNYPDYYSLYSGQGIEHIHSVKPAVKVIEDLVDEALNCMGPDINRIKK